MSIPISQFIPPLYYTLYSITFYTLYIILYALNSLLQPDFLLNFIFVSLVHVFTCSSSYSFSLVLCSLAWIVFTIHLYPFSCWWKFNFSNFQNYNFATCICVRIVMWGASLIFVPRNGSDMLGQSVLLFFPHMFSLQVFIHFYELKRSPFEWWLPNLQLQSDLPGIRSLHLPSKYSK